MICKVLLNDYEKYVEVEDSLINVSKSVDIYDAEQNNERLKCTMKYRMV